MSGQRSRRKGHQFERDIAILFRELGFPDACRQLEYQAVNAKGVDLDKVGLFRVQCKRGKKYSSITAIEEIQTQGIKLLITKADGKKPVVALYLEDFIEGLKDSGFWFQEK